MYKQSLPKALPQDFANTITCSYCSDPFPKLIFDDHLLVCDTKLLLDQIAQEEGYELNPQKQQGSKRELNEKILTFQDESDGSGSDQSFPENQSQFEAFETGHFYQPDHEVADSLDPKMDYNWPMKKVSIQQQRLDPPTICELNPFQMKKELPKAPPPRISSQAPVTIRENPFQEYPDIERKCGLFNSPFEPLQPPCSPFQTVLKSKPPCLEVNKEKVPTQASKVSSQSRTRLITAPQMLPSFNPPPPPPPPPPPFDQGNPFSSCRAQNEYPFIKLPNCLLNPQPPFINRPPMPPHFPIRIPIVQQLNSHLPQSNPTTKKSSITTCTYRGVSVNELCHGDEAEEECSICYLVYKIGDQLSILDCRHIYHTHCINQWIQKESLCPFCRTEIK